MMEPAYVGVVALAAGVVAVLFEGIRRRDVAVVTNSAASLTVALLPVLVDVGLLPLAGRHVSTGPVLLLWVGLAGFLHSLGMLGLYDTVSWWDRLTHTLSAALFAALAYAGLVVVVENSPALELSPFAVASVTVLFTFWMGIAWEVLELFAREVSSRFDIEPVLVHYGWRDTAFDLVFDVVGAVLAVIVARGVFVPLAEQLPGVARSLLLGVFGVSVLGSLLLALGIGLIRNA